MSTFTDLEKDAASVDGFVSENGLIPTRRNGPKPSYQYLVDGWNAEIAATILEMNKSRGFRVVGTFADGFTYELFNDVGIDADGNSWIYVGAGAPNKVVSAGTVPSVGAGYEQVTFNDHNSLINRDAIGAHDNIYTRKYNSVNDIVSDPNLVIGMKVESYNYYSDIVGGGMLYEVVPAGTSVADGGSYIDATASNLQLKANINSKYPESSHFGLRGLEGESLDEGQRLNTFLEYCRVNGSKTITLNGDYNTTEQINLVVTGRKLEMVRGEFTIRATTSLDLVLNIELAYFVYFSGKIRVFGTGSYPFNSRTCKRGVSINSTTRAHFEHLFVQNFYQYGIDCQSTPGGATLTNCGHVVVRDCGSYEDDPSSDRAAPLTYSNPVNLGTGGSGGQKTTLTVDSIPNGFEPDMTVWIDNELYLCVGMDEGAGTIDIFPWLDQNAPSSGVGVYVVGAGVHLEGGDSGIVGFDMIDAARCGIGLWTDALYGTVSNRVVCQANFMGVQYGGRLGGAFVTDNIAGLYVEGNTIDFAASAAGATGINITSSYALNLDKVVTFSPRGADNLLVSRGLQGFTVKGEFSTIEYIQSPKGVSGTNNVLSMYEGYEEKAFVVGSNGKNWIPKYSKSLNHLFGHNCIRFNVVSFGASIASISFSLDPDDASDGWTFKGGATTYSYSPTSSGVRVVITANEPSKEWLVSVYEQDN